MVCTTHGGGSFLPGLLLLRKVIFWRSDSGGSGLARGRHALLVGVLTNLKDDSGGSGLLLSF